MEFKMPELGEGVMEGELVNWLVKPGDHVSMDQPLCEVMTDKATIEVPSPVDGTISELKVKEGETIQVEQVIMTYESGGASASKSKEKEKSSEGEEKKASSGSNGSSKKEESEKDAPKKKEAKSEDDSGDDTEEKKEPSKAPSSKPTPQPMAAASPGAGAVYTDPSSRPLAAPATRKFAREMGVDLAAVSATGPEGRILKSDVEQYLTRSSFGAVSTGRTAANYPSGGEKRVAFKGLRKKISEKMRESKDHAAHFTYVEEADATQLVQLRKKAKAIGANQGIKVTFLPFLMKAMVASLRQYPILNSSLDEKNNELVYKHYYNIGLSVQTDDGLMAPVVKNVEHKSILEIAKDIQILVEKARNKKLSKEDFEGSTITLTNAGSIGGLFATPVINYPEVAILGFNKIFKKPVVKEVNGRDRIVIRDWTYFSISLDHRVVDGAVGAEFMKTFIDYVESPTLLLLDSF